MLKQTQIELFLVQLLVLVIKCPTLAGYMLWTLLKYVACFFDFIGILDLNFICKAFFCKAYCKATLQSCYLLVFADASLIPQNEFGGTVSLKCSKKRSTELLNQYCALWAQKIHVNMNARKKAKSCVNVCPWWILQATRSCAYIASSGGARVPSWLM